MISMIYLLLNENQIKILYLKKTLLGHYDIVFYEKKYQMSFLKNGQLINPDLTASAIKEALTLVSEQKIKDRDVTLILPQDSFEFLRTEVPHDMAPVVLATYIREKARAQLTVDLENCYFDHMVLESEDKRQMTFYALDNDIYNKFLEPFNLLDLKVKNVIPETLSYFKLFEKTLRKEKKENIFYVSYDGNTVQGYVYDSFGLLEPTKWKKELKEKDDIEDILKAKAAELEKKGIKLNRLILSGEESENIRQDTFTKNVGVWTNPLKRIMPHFYADYLKMFTTQNNKTIPYLQFDACIGGFILANENRDFSMFKRKPNDFSYKSYKAQHFTFPWKLVGLFVLAFALTTAAIFGLSRLNLDGINLSAMTSRLSFTQPTPTPAPTAVPTNTPTPTPEPDRESLRVKVLNGSGTAGKASDVKAILSEAGYTDILTGNADSFDYEKTEIQLKEDSALYFEVLKADLQEYAQVVQGDPLDEDEAADAVVIIGSDFE
jgi:hypothetical protein